MNEDYVKQLAELYEQYEEMRTNAKQYQDSAKDLKNQMIEIINESGVDSVIVPGLEEDEIELSVKLVERISLNKKAIAEKLDMKQKDIKKIEDWVRLTNEGQITPEMIEEATETTEQEQFSAEVPEDNNEQ